MTAPQKATLVTILFWIGPITATLVYLWFRYRNKRNSTQ